jgi:hypothetical protein
MLLYVDALLTDCYLRHQIKRGTEFGRRLHDQDVDTNGEAPSEALRD